MIQAAVVTAGPPAPSCLRDHVHGGSPRATGAADDAEFLHLAKFSFGQSELVGWQSAGASIERRARCGNVVLHTVLGVNRCELRSRNGRKFG
ncbi:hypothetical protein M513_07803 [Trichuris suis]|uniref:Uncharacterized protein n=1 Tax=Trichuris suis TaxID=68888 RepID=A0A085M2F2_9BILA|nr:hypothetical protein M513_07803 [Trichuris suis]